MAILNVTRIDHFLRVAASYFGDLRFDSLMLLPVTHHFVWETQPVVSAFDVPLGGSVNGQNSLHLVHWFYLIIVHYVGGKGEPDTKNQSLSCSSFQTHACTARQTIFTDFDAVFGSVSISSRGTAVQNTTLFAPLYDLAEIAGCSPFVRRIGCQVKMSQSDLS